MNKHNRFWLGLALGLLLFVPGLAGGAAAQSLTQGYQSDHALQNGIIVRLQPGSKVKVQPVTSGTQKDMLGVVVSSTDAPVSLSDPGLAEVFVANFGQYSVLVSTENGVIKTGDLITISSLDGVGMKADEQQQVVLGKALQGFADDSNAQSHATLDDITKTKVAIGRILIDISVARNPTYSGDTAAGVPHFLSRAAKIITNKPVTALRLYACLAVLFVAVVVAGAIIYSGVRSAMTAVGRNPLAKKSILRGMVNVTLMALIIVIIGIIAVYLLLKI